ncbi:hypothetical protein E2493_09885 [Sphingomonas parva]|uniref:Uncharacterized protein n=1 Tax=Sphingomonas parva TaxID=2555898 RepID=A0A4Y8ZVG7_9SPHN|nr:Wadjet anti-phage system protein JetA family protein [Sphingomonas parva]TFI58436.1 hypothetical protein E2493_09885 [Sphingomonas parva]
MLFGQLSSEIFTPLAGGNRQLYESMIEAIYSEFYRSDLLFPSEAEVVTLIYNSLAAAPELWREDEAPVELHRLVPRSGRRVRRRRVGGADDDATGTLIGRARHIYKRLVVTGWLEQTRYGLKVTVDMTSGAMRLAEFLCSMKEGMSEQLGGLIVEVRNALDGVRTLPSENALGLNKAARDAAAFGRYLRSVLSALREIDRQLLASETMGERLRHYFEDFIERVLLRDYSAIASTSHPYRFRHRILASLDALEEAELDLAALAAAYHEAKLAADLRSARDLVIDDLVRIRRVFDRIEDAFRRIQQHRSRLETKLRNVVRYAGRRGGFLQRSEAIILHLDRLFAGAPYARREIASPIEPRQVVLSPALLARPRGVRTQIIGEDMVLPPPDPLRALRRQLERDYLDRLTVSPAQIARFLERRVPPFGEAAAAGMWIDTVDDFLAFEALRLAVGADAIPEQLALGFEFLPAAGTPVDNDWLVCPNFIVRRLGDSVTLEVRRAA